MKKNSLLYILLAFLVIMNGFLLFKQLNTADQKVGKRPAPGNFIAKQLDFDKTQLKKFEEQDSMHRERIEAILSDIVASKERMFDKVADESVNKTELNALAAKIADNEIAKELEIFRFFKEVGEICNDKQKVLFKKIINDALGGQGPPPPGRDGPPPNGHKGPPPGGHDGQPPSGQGEEGRPPPPEH